MNLLHQEISADIKISKVCDFSKETLRGVVEVAGDKALSALVEFAAGVCVSTAIAESPQDAVGGHDASHQCDRWQRIARGKPQSCRHDRNRTDITNSPFRPTTRRILL